MLYENKFLKKLKINISFINFFNLLLVLAIFSIDRITKNQIIENNLNYLPAYINNYLNLDLVWNTGIGFGLLNLQAGIYYHLISLAIILVLLFIIFLSFRSEKYERVFYSIIIGGAAGNLYDRMVYYAVPDFIDFHYNDYHWFTFNIADIFITIGIILIIIKEIFAKK
jgi:signal peptidase II